MVARIFFAIAAVLFFLAGVSANFIPNPTAWGLVTMALGLAIGNWTPQGKPA